MLTLQTVPRQSRARHPACAAGKLSVAATARPPGAAGRPPLLFSRVYARGFVAERRDVLCIRSRINARVAVLAGLAAQFQYARPQSTQERAIVRDEDHGAFKVLERSDQHFLRGQVEMVGRLVQHQEIRRIVEHAGHGEARLLAARERTDLLIHVVAGKLKRTGQRAQRPNAILREILLQLFENREIGIEHVQRLLGEVAHGEAGAELHVAAIRHGRARDHLEQGRLACPIAAHYGPAFATANGKAEAVVNHTRTIGLSQVCHYGHLIARTRRHAEIELYDSAFLRQFDLLDLVERLDTALHLRGFCGVRLEALDEALLFRQHGLLSRERRLLVTFADIALAFVEIIVAGVDSDLARVDFRDFRDDAVHEFAIMRGHEKRALEALEELLKPDDGFEIEVVGRFVHQQDVGPAQQHAGQRHTHFPAARKRAHIAIDLIVFETEAMEHFARLGFERVAAEVFVFFLGVSETREYSVHFVKARGIFHGVLQGFEFVVQIARAPAAGDGFIEHGAAGHFFDVLTEVADGEFLRDGNVAFVRRFLTDHHAEEGGFAGAVGADEADFFAGVELERGVDKDELLAVLFVDAGERDQYSVYRSLFTFTVFWLGRDVAEAATAGPSGRAVLCDFDIVKAMYRRIRVAFAGLIVCGLAFTADLGETFYSNVHQLTSGGQNAEAYWSPDGKRLIFQSTRDDLKCDQIFTMNADGSGQRMVSNGKGRTTCGYFLPDNKSIIYASTYLAGDACPADADHSKGYVWAVYPGYDIFSARDDGTNIKRLTDAPGYDAEATVNAKTNKVIYTSMASGDLDLWQMNPDGSDKKQITKSYGYDGGAVFSRDGKKIAWRAGHPTTPETKQKYADLLRENLTSPMKMELFVADADGKNTKQITNFGCASFAPTFTPDGKQLLFASNKHECDSGKFELYLINIDGTGLKRVTNYGGFTSFPEFSPDGSKLVFVSDWKAAARYEFNIFTADWKR